MSGVIEKRPLEQPDVRNNGILGVPFEHYGRRSKDSLIIKLAEKLSITEQADMGALLEFFGPELVEWFEGKRLVVPWLDVGYGHVIQAVELSRYIATMLGMEVMCVNPMEFMSKDECHPWKLKQKVLQCMHAFRPDIIAELKAQIRDYDVLYQLLDQVFVWATTFSLHGLSLEETQKGSFVAELGKSIVGKVNKNEIFSSLLLRAVRAMDIFATELSMGETVLQLTRDFNALGAITTHTSTERAIPAGKVEKYVGKGNRLFFGTVVPDNGYITVPEKVSFNGETTYVQDASILEAFTAARALGYFVPLFYGVADDRVANTLRHIYRVPEDKVSVVGTIGGDLSHAEIKEKFRARRKKILLPVNGNASNVSLLVRAMYEIDQADDAWRKSYITIVFLGDQPDEKVQEVLAAYEAMKNKQAVKIVRTRTKTEAAARKIQLQKECVIEAGRSAGENALTGARTGTCELCTESGAVNEEHNMRAMWRRGAAIPSAWPGPTFDFWCNKGFVPGSGFTHAYDNFPAYISDLFASGIPQDTVQRGLIGLENHTKLHITALMMLHALGFTHERARALNDWITFVRQNTQANSTSIRGAVAVR